MPKKTKKQKIRARERVDEVLPFVSTSQEKTNKPKERLSPRDASLEPHDNVKKTRAQKEMHQHDRVFTSYFLSDLRKTGIAIAIILGIEGFIYYAFSTNLFSVVDNLPF
jgi:hypothetical protein